MLDPGEPIRHLCGTMELVDREGSPDDHGAWLV